MGDGTMPDAVVVAGLYKSYGSVQAVREVSFTIGQGETVAILGPNGAGKSTTLEILEGFRRRDGGTATVLGIDPGDKARAAELRDRTGVVLQDIAVEPYLTVRETVAREAGYYSAPRDVDEVIGLVGLTEKRDSRVNKLSGGQQRRLDVAYGLVGNPKLLFLDEPTTGFDPSARRGAWDMVNDLRGLGTTIMLTTHYMDEAQELADNIVVIGAGQVVAEGTPDSLGGRDTAALHVRFRLPDGIDPASLPVAVTVDHHGFCELTTDEDIKVLNTLTSWSLKQRVPLEGLVATRPSLEDVYLSLVGRDLLDDEAVPATIGATDV
jgi:ABC-2 type transport system ATP-binding protein